MQCSTLPPPSGRDRLRLNPSEYAMMLAEPSHNTKEVGTLTYVCILRMSSKEVTVGWLR